MTFIAVFLTIALVASNVFWLAYLRNHIKDERSERWQLQERIRQPQAEHVPIGALINEHARPAPEPNPAQPIFTDEEPEDEYDLVGQVNPSTPLRDDVDDD